MRRKAGFLGSSWSQPKIEITGGFRDLLLKIGEAKIKTRFLNLIWKPVSKAFVLPSHGYAPAHAAVLMAGRLAPGPNDCMGGYLMDPKLFGFLFGCCFVSI